VSLQVNAVVGASGFRGRLPASGAMGRAASLDRCSDANVKTLFINSHACPGVAAVSGHL
jgi:hypothetical protein